MKVLYIVFVASNFRSGQAIRLLTRGEYNHVALSLTERLDRLYSFARHNYYQPLLGGFEVERPARYLHGGQEVRVKVCAWPVSDVRYAHICERLRYFVQNRACTRYNFLNVLTYPLHRRIAVRDAYTCIEFLSELLGFRRQISIRRLERLLAGRQVYEGALSGAMLRPPLPPRKDFFEKRSRVVTYWNSCRLVASLCALACTGALQRWL